MRHRSHRGAKKMNLENVEKKLREARFHLAKMNEQERRAFGDKEPFDFHLSAFLDAAKIVDNRLRHEQGAIYKPWRTAWDGRLTAKENELIKLMVDDRNVEVHGSASGRGVKTESIKVGHSYSDASGTLEVFSTPIPGTGMGGGATIYKPSYYFTIAGAERKATAACTDYLALLERMVTDFKTDHP
jgi:hypothetical protein